MPRPAIVLLLVAVPAACAPKCPESSAPAVPSPGASPAPGSPAAAAAGEAPPPHAVPAASPPAPTTAGAPGPSASPAAGAEPGPGAAPAGALPEVVVENVGLHIGGGPNDDATKAPFQAAVAGHFEEFRRCYVHVEDPKKGGTFGVDLLIGRAGGKADVKQPRTGMKGAEFRDCVLGVFRSVEFEKPKKGPTMISYSLRFQLKG